MHLVSQQRSRNLKIARRVTAVTAMVALSAGMLTPVAQAEPLADLQQRQSQIRDQKGAAEQSIGESQRNVEQATSELEQSRSQLQSARAELASIRVDLDIARNHYSLMVEALAKAERDLKAAKAEVRKGEENLAAQLRLIGHMARDAYQQRNPLEGLAVVFSSSSTAELEQRIQWNTTIFDVTAAEKARLDALQLKLEKARDKMAALEAQARIDRQTAADQLALITSLERQAASQERAVANLVASNQRMQAAAEKALAADEAAYRELESMDVQLTKEIKAEVARLKAIEEEKRRKALEEKRRKAQEAKEAAERAAAEAAKKADAAGQAVVKVETPKAESRPAAKTSRSEGRKVSSYGFIRPIAANPGSPFGRRYHPILHYWRLHAGTDFGARTGTPIYAARAGTVLRAERAGGYGNFVLIGHGSIIGGKYVTTGYAHQSKIVVRKGQKVEQGQLIGYVGNTGLSTTPHLHLELRLDGTPVNAMNYVP